MLAPIKQSELTFRDTIVIDFGFSGLSERHAQSIMRDLVRDQWPTQRRPEQSVYVIRLNGNVAAAYPRDFSPVIYVGEGNAFNRVYQHTSWLVPLVLSVPKVSIEVRIAEVARRNNSTLYKYVEADLIRWFQTDYGALPWFNQQRERNKEEYYTYESDAERDLRRLIGVGAGNTFLWAIQPTKNNDLHEPYVKGVEEAA
jgi:hypothetical protein